MIDHEHKPAGYNRDMEVLCFISMHPVSVRQIANDLGFTGNIEVNAAIRRLKSSYNGITVNHAGGKRGSTVHVKSISWPRIRTAGIRYWNKVYGEQKDLSYAR